MRKHNQEKSRRVVCRLITCALKSGMIRENNKMRLLCEIAGYKQFKVKSFHPINSTVS
jgi:hypothetical protein